MNMSYCRFENTDNDLRDCEATLDALLDGDEETLSESELRCAAALVARCDAIARKFREEIEGITEDDDISANDVADAITAACDGEMRCRGCGKRSSSGECEECANS